MVTDGGGSDITGIDDGIDGTDGGNSDGTDIDDDDHHGDGASVGDGCGNGGDDDSNEQILYLGVFVKFSYLQLIVDTRWQWLKYLQTESRFKH